MNHPFAYETERMIRSFFPPTKFDMITESITLADNYILTKMSETVGRTILTAEIADGNVHVIKKEELSSEAALSEKENALGRAVVTALSEYTSTVPEWGILTGVRPVKLIGNIRTKKGDSAEDYIRHNLLVSENKLALADRIISVQNRVLSDMPKNSFSLYVSIPFCPARCSYCSFVSHSVDKAAKLIPAYVDRLAEEIREIGALTKELGLVTDTVYFGGGTPTAISAEQLETLFEAVESFDLSDIREYTVEAGRPDTITEEKLRMMKKHNVTRISINPQTMNDSVLREIGRNHTSEEIYRSFELARSLGFDNINCDLIAGLPTDTTESFRKSIEKIIALSPENITVHTLALKRSSSLYQSHAGFLCDTFTVGEMVKISQDMLLENGYNPYYLYRQKNSCGNHENVGYAKPDRQSLYNIYIMEEAQTILATGSGASTKLVSPFSGKIERIMNTKFPYEYISRESNSETKKDLISTFFKVEKQTNM